MDSDETNRMLRAAFTRLYAMEQLALAFMIRSARQELAGAADPAAHAVAMRRDLADALEAMRVIGPSAESAEQAQVREMAIAMAGMVVTAAEGSSAA